MDITVENEMVGCDEESRLLRTKLEATARMIGSYSGRLVVLKLRSGKDRQESVYVLEEYRDLLKTTFFDGLVKWRVGTLMSISETERYDERGAKIRVCSVDSTIIDPVMTMLNSFAEETDTHIIYQPEVFRFNFEP